MLFVVYEERITNHYYLRSSVYILKDNSYRLWIDNSDWIDERKYLIDIGIDKRVENKSNTITFNRVKVYLSCS